MFQQVAAIERLHQEGDCAISQCLLENLIVIIGGDQDDRQLTDYVGPAFGALLFVAVMSLVAEPTRRTLNTIILAGASGVYLSGGFGLWELTYPVIGTAIAFRALGSYRWIGVGWLIHAGWDIAHHLWGNPIWPFMPSSAFGCMIFDSMIAPWFLAGAPSFLKRPHAPMHAATR